MIEAGSSPLPLLQQRQYQSKAGQHKAWYERLQRTILSTNVEFSSQFPSLGWKPFCSFWGSPPHPPGPPTPPPLPPPPGRLHLRLVPRHAGAQLEELRRLHVELLAKRPDAARRTAHAMAHRRDGITRPAVQPRCALGGFEVGKGEASPVNIPIPTKID